MSHFYIRENCNFNDAYVNAKKTEDEAESEFWSLDRNAVDLIYQPEIQLLPKAEKEALLQSYYDVSESLDQQSHFAREQTQKVVKESQCNQQLITYFESSNTTSPGYYKELTEWRKYQYDKPPSIWERMPLPFDTKQK